MSCVSLRRRALTITQIESQGWAVKSLWNHAALNLTDTFTLVMENRLAL